MSLREVSWNEVKDKIAQINPSFYETMSNIAPHHPNAKLYIASYKFGDLIVNDGITQLPINDQLIPLNHSDLPEPFKTDLVYSRMAAGMLLNKTAEIFINFETRVHPINLFSKGNVYGLWELFDQQDSLYYRRIWHIAAGSRTLFLVPKVMDHASHHRMQRLLHLDDATYLSNNMYHQGQLFKNIANSPYFNNDWRCDILYLSKNWFKDLGQKEWQQFHYTCLKYDWEKSNHLRNKTTFELIWQLLTQSQAEIRLKANLYAFESIKHLISIAIGASIAQRPLSTTDETSAPISIIEQAYLEVYKLKHYIPTILGPTLLEKNCKDPVYYSFMLPTLLALSPEHNFRNTLEDERNIKSLLEHLQKNLVNHTEVLYRFVENVEFTFFHYEKDPLYDIKASKELIQYDSRFNTYSDKNREFCENGPFVRSCVRIHNKIYLRSEEQQK